MKTGATVLLALLVAIVLWQADVSFVAGQTVSFNFNLLGPNTAVDPTTAETIEMTGSGSFINPTGPIMASGSFIISSATGAVVARGTWSATTFNMFVDFGGPNPGTQGGHLMMHVTLFSDGGAPLLAAQPIPMTVTCRVNAPPGTGHEGVTIGDFTNATSGHTLFHRDD